MNIVSQYPCIVHGGGITTTPAVGDAMATAAAAAVVSIVVVLFSVYDTDDVECCKGDHMWRIEQAHVCPVRVIQNKPICPNETLSHVRETK